MQKSITVLGTIAIASFILEIPQAQANDVHPAFYSSSGSTGYPGTSSSAGRKDLPRPELRIEGNSRMIKLLESEPSQVEFDSMTLRELLVQVLEESRTTHSSYLFRPHQRVDALSHLHACAVRVIEQAAHQGILDELIRKFNELDPVRRFNIRLPDREEFDVIVASLTDWSRLCEGAVVGKSKI